jgi:hypothetical protein
MMSTTVAYYLCGRRAGRRRRRNLLLLFTAAAMLYLMYRDAPESVLRADEEGGDVSTVVPTGGGGGGGKRPATDGSSVKAADADEPPPSPAPAVVAPASASRSRSRAPPASPPPSASTTPAPPSPSGSPSPPPPPQPSASPSGAATPSPSGKPSTSPAPPPPQAVAGAAEEARLLATSPQARQDFFVDCLRSSLRPSCRPRADDPPFVVLPRDQWRAHVTDVLKFTVPHRAVPPHSYGGYSGPWVESVFVTYFMGLDSGKPDEMGYRRRRRLLRQAQHEGAERRLAAPPPSQWEGDDVNTTEAGVLPYAWRRVLADDTAAAAASKSGGQRLGDVPEPARGSILDALERAFYPLVPVFARWSDAAFGDDRAMHPKNKELFEHQGNPAGSPLRRDVVYVALSQHDRGEVASGLTCNHYRNVVSLSSGGWGSVAIPLIKGTAAHVSTEAHGDAQPAAAAVAGGSPPWQARPRLRMFSFVGTNHLGRGVAFDAFHRSSLPGGGGSPWFDTLMTPDWRGVARGSVFTLSPRGYGRTSFRLFELLQYGSVSVYLYDDVAWTPYQHGADFEPPGSLPPALLDGGKGDVRRFGAVPLRAADDASEADAGDVGVYAPLTDAQAAAFAASDRGKAGWSGPGRYAVPGANVTAGVLNGGGMWGPGGVGFAVAYDEVASFVCVACEFLRPGSAARWRHVRTLPLHRYGSGAGQACPCTASAWEDAARGMASGPQPTGPWVLPPDSLVAEMERRVAAVRDRYFTYRGVMGHVADLLRSPLESELVCVPKPDDYGTPRSDPPFIE